MTGTVLIGAPAPGVRQLTISRPARRNALDRATYAALVSALAKAATDDTIRVVVLTGANGCFTSGNDLSDFQDVKTPVDETEHPSAGMTFLKALIAFPKPVIAAVEGFAIGIGTTLLLHCDRLCRAGGELVEDDGYGPLLRSNDIINGLRGDRR
jgi:enoyl-CoA hydratase/carnithine racemase